MKKYENVIDGLHIVLGKRRANKGYLYLKWCWVELNHRLTDFQSDALPPELQHRCFLHGLLHKYRFFYISCRISAFFFVALLIF